MTNVLESKKRAFLLPRSPTGSIFGDASVKERKASMNSVRKYQRQERARPKDSHGFSNWGVWRDSLSGYNLLTRHYTPQGELKSLSLEQFLLEEIKKPRSEPLKVLDFGVGSGEQWLKFLKDHCLQLGRDVEFYGSALTRRPFSSEVREKLRHRIRVARGDNLARRFKEHIGTFDVIISHYSGYDQSLNFLENAHALLRNGGQLICNIPTPTHSEALFSRFKIHEYGPVYAFHLTKL